MKKILTYCCIVVFALINIAAISQSESCDIRSLKNELLKSLKPGYRYDSYKSTRFAYTDKEQRIEIAAPLFKGEDFRFIFNTKGLPKDIDIKLYEKKGKKGKELFSLSNVKEDGKNIYTFDPQVNKTIYLNYIIPRTSKTNLKGCVVCVIGCKMY